MEQRTTYLGAGVSVAVFVGILVLSQDADDLISKSVLATDIFLGFALGSLLSSAYFVPRAIRTWRRSNNRRR